MKSYRVLLYISLLWPFLACSGQTNPKYIGKAYGTFDLDKISFSEQPDTLFSKTEAYYRLPHEDGYYDDTLKRFIPADTLYHIYRIIPRYVTEGMFCFKNVVLKAKEVVDFYIDKTQHFRRAEVSVYRSTKQYKGLLAACSDFSDRTPDNVRSFNNNKYVILQKEDKEQQIQTTLYCLDNRDENDNDPGKDYFVRIAISNLKIKTDRFYKLENDDIKK